MIENETEDLDPGTNPARIMVTVRRGMVPAEVGMARGNHPLAVADGNTTCTRRSSPREMGTGVDEPDWDGERIEEEAPEAA